MTRDREAILADLSEYAHVAHDVNFDGHDDYDEADANVSHAAQSARNVYLPLDRQANCISSAIVEEGRNEWGKRRHTVAIDIDHRVRVVESSTPGHGHLYIDVPMEWEQYERLLDVLEECGIVQPGYVSASKVRQATFLRLPWVKKPDRTSQPDPY